MRILLCNDDGIHAPGLAALRAAVSGLGDVTIVAPASQQSAVGHAITISDPIKMHPVHQNGELFGYAVGGTPADCVKLACCALLDQKPDLVLSGINLGPNAGISAIYSGTVSAATEGTILGIPSMAVSIDTFVDPRWETAARAAREVTELLIAHPLPPGVLLNVNVPNRPWEEIRGYAPARMGMSRFVETFDQRCDPRGNVYFWMDGYLEMLGDPDGSDVRALEEGKIALTPIHFDLTHAAGLERLRAWPLFKT